MTASRHQAFSTRVKRYARGCSLALFAAIVISGCADPQPPKPPQPSINLAGYPPSFRAGYADGCASAKPEAPRKRDEPRFKADSNYAVGWADGYDICRRR